MKGQSISRLYVAILIILCSLSMIACEDSHPGTLDKGPTTNSVSTGCGLDSTPSSKSDFSVEQGVISQLAKNISTDAGKVIAAANGNPDRTVIVMEETHTSRAGQLEIALMLLRLHDKHNLQQISLEGTIADQNELPAKWFQNLPDSQETVQAKERVAVRLLKEGEISSAEFIALTQRDMRVKGNERADEYDVKMQDKSSGAPLRYLLAIVQKSASPNQIRQANQMAEAGKQKEALDVLFRADSWVNEHYEKLTNKSGTPSIEELVVVYRQIEAKAREVGARIDPDASEGMRDALNFFVTASRRSCTMVKNTLAMCDTAPKSPVALIIGAAHTAKVVELLKASNVSYAVISPNSLEKNSKHGDLSLLAYNRKLDQKSVDSPGLLGNYLASRRKPTSVLGKQWFQSKSETYLAIRLIAAAAAGGKKPPFQSLDSELNALTAIKIDPSSIPSPK